MRDEMSIPVVRLEVQYMKHAILSAFTDLQLKLDEDVKRAVDEFCAPGNVAAIIKRAVDASLKDAIESEIEKFYRYGAGRAAIAEAVQKRLYGDEPS